MALLQLASAQHPRARTRDQARLEDITAQLRLLMSAGGAPVEAIARLVGHSSTATTEGVYRKELRTVITEGAEVVTALLKSNTPDGSG